MSIKLMTIVWEADLPRDEKYVLLCYADHANDDGILWPSIERIAWKTGYGKRQVQYLTRQFVKQGYLVSQGSMKGGRSKTNHYCLNIAALPAREPWQNKGAVSAPFHSKKDVERVQFTTERVQFTTEKGAVAIASDPSVNHHINHHLTDEILTDQTPEEKYKARIRKAMARGETAQISLEDRFY